MPIAQREPVATATDEASRHSIGGNMPPLEDRIAMEFRDALLEDVPNFLTRIDEFVAATGRATVTDDETLGKAGDLDNMLRKAESHVTQIHKQVKQPYLDGGRAVDAEKKHLEARITNARYTLRDMMNGYLAEKEAKRRAAEQARIAEERKQAELAAEAERARQVALGENDAEKIAEIEAVAYAPATVARAEPVRSDAGATVSGRTVWNSQVEDAAKAFRAVKSDPKVLEAIEAAVQRLVKAGKRDIPGVRIWSTIQAVAR